MAWVHPRGLRLDVIGVPVSDVDAAVRCYVDLEGEHDRHRAQVVDGLEALARVRFEVPDGDPAA